MSPRRNPAARSMEGSAGLAPAAVVVNRVVEGDPSAVWRGLTVDSAISQWFEPCHGETDVRYSLQFTGDSGELYSKYVTILECDRTDNGGKYLFLLQDEGYPDSTVKVSVAASGAGRCLVELSHFAPPADLVEGYREGWSDYLDSFERYLSSGVAEDRPRAGSE